MLQNRHMMAYLKQTDIDEVLQYFPEEMVTFDQFYPIGKEVILRVYRAKDPSEACTTRTLTLFTLTNLMGYINNLKSTAVFLLRIEKLIMECKYLFVTMTINFFNLTNFFFFVCALLPWFSPSGLV